MLYAMTVRNKVTWVIIIMRASVATNADTDVTHRRFRRFVCVAEVANGTLPKLGILGHANSIGNESPGHPLFVCKHRVVQQI